MMAVSPSLGGATGPFARVLHVVDKHSRGAGLSMGGIEKMLEFTNPHEGPVGGIDGRARREAEMMATGRVPDVYEAAVRRFREKVLPEMRIKGDIERLKLFESAAGLRWVGMEDDGDGQGKTGVVDVHWKKVVKNVSVPEEENGENIRVCVRCGGLSEDIPMSKDWSRLLLQHISRQMSRCVCEGAWLIESENEK